MNDERQSHDVEFVEYVVKSIVDHPDDVKLARDIDEMGVLITLTVNPDDMGQVIGRSGATAKAVRTLLRVIGARNNARVNLKINEPEGGSTPRSAAAPAETAGDEVSVVEGAPEVTEAPEEKPSVDQAIDDLDL